MSSPYSSLRLKFMKGLLCGLLKEYGSGTGSFPLSVLNSLSDFREKCGMSGFREKSGSSNEKGVRPLLAAAESYSSAAAARS